ncbi:DUF5330 domain-containing protein [Mesorhizobium sp. SB112]|uniref:DUF5330 domain-containing protein n=1 Tax=Mesorhizobium sp. SB112 TaxID=3151853 RepID=UPI0032674C73
MGFLIKAAFWFAVVLLILPLGGGEEGDKPTIGAIQAFFAAKEAIGDISGICERKPDVCEAGQSVMQTVGVRAKESARIAYEMLDTQFGQPDVATTGSVPEAQGHEQHAVEAPAFEALPQPVPTPRPAH